MIVCSLFVRNYTSLTPHIHLLSSKVINHGRDIGFVPANNQFVDELLSIAQQVMSDGIVNTSQDDVGAPFRLNSINVAYVSSWTRPSNCIIIVETGLDWGAFKQKINVEGVFYQVKGIAYQLGRNNAKKVGNNGKKCSKNEIPLVFD